MNDDKSGLWKEGFGAIGATLKALEDQGVTAKGLQMIRSNKGVAAAVADLVERLAFNEEEHVAIEVDYTETIRRQLLASDVWFHYLVKDEYFPIPEECKGQKIKKVVRLFRVDENENWIPDSGYRWANIFELTAFSEQIRFSDYLTIVAAGSETPEEYGALTPVLMNIAGRKRVYFQNEHEAGITGNYFLAVVV